MPIDLKRTRESFRKLDRQLSRLANKATPRNVHQFRTISRRVETILEELAPRTNRNARKLSKQLVKIRKKAGRLRDLDIQIAALRDLKGHEANGQRSRLLQSLLEERMRREKRLVNALDRKAVAEIRKRLKRETGKLALPPNTEPLLVALNKLARLAREHAPLTERTLHEYRIMGKRARYIAELSDRQREAAFLIKELKAVQDVVGDWHDWLELSVRAENLLGGVKDSALVAMLRNVTRAKFRQGVDALVEMRTKLSGNTIGLIPNPDRVGRRPTAAGKDKDNEAAAVA